MDAQDLHAHAGLLRVVSLVLAWAVIEFLIRVDRAR